MWHGLKLKLPYPSILCNKDHENNYVTQQQCKPPSQMTQEGRGKLMSSSDEILLIRFHQSPHAFQSYPTTMAAISFCFSSEGP